MLAIGCLQAVFLFIIICVVVLYATDFTYMYKYKFLIDCNQLCSKQFFGVYMYVHALHCDLTAHLCVDFRLVF